MQALGNARVLTDDGFVSDRVLLIEEERITGLVAKDESSFYIGGRTFSWLKVKQAEYRAGKRGSRLADSVFRSPRTTSP